ncbi:glycosyltransferase family 4 protein [Massilia niabensis]|uniref:Glycosyltransferase family 4 protein n=1 Tax=Massilia niabensis TaxID=544910 RepID=A0ABW0L8P7_9BURK
MTASRPTTPAPLLELLLAEPAPGECAVAVLPPAAAGLAPAPATPRPRKLRRLGAPLMPLFKFAARAVLRRPQVRQLALRILKRSPALYARAYQAMMASGSAAPAAEGWGKAGTQADEIDGLSPRANAILRTLRRMQETPPRDVAARPRLAFVSPLPPQRTGVATYAVELLAELSGQFEIELIVAQPGVALPEVILPPALGHLPVRQADWFAEHGAGYDQVLYQFGNSPFHSHMFSLLARFPGVVVLHDFFLGGALVHAQMSGADPRAWGEALLHSHGYRAVHASETPVGRAQAHKDWPCSLPVLEGATRTIVHSRHARQLASDWFGPGAANGIDVIPHPRTPPPATDRAAARIAARSALGIADDCFLVCSFGFVAPNKLTHELLRAWIGSSLHGNPACMLVLVGANHDSPYGVEVEALIRGAAAGTGAGANIRIAGWNEDAVYRQYLQAADAGVQLRTNAHGESSGAVLDCMNYGLPTIVNANGSMAEFPPEAVWRLPDAFEIKELSAALETLHRDPARCAALGQGAVALLDARFRPARCAALYLETLARARAGTAAQHAAWRAALAQAAPAGEQDLRRLAASLAAGERPARRQLLVDVSDWAQAGTPDAAAAGQLTELLAQAGPDLRVEPVWLDTSLDTAGSAPCLRQARNAAGRLLGLGWPIQAEPVVDVHAGDIFYAPDAAAPAVARAFDSGLLAAWQARGVRVNLLVRSLPGGGAPRAAAGADRLLCTSEAIAQQLATQLAALRAQWAAAPHESDGL